MRDILIITNYFPPETGAASNRLFHLADGLQKNDFRVTVLTPLPNYPTGKIFKDYKGKFKVSSEENGILIHRLWIFSNNSTNKILRLIAMLSYSFSLIWYIMLHKIPNKVIVQSPPLLVAFISMLFLSNKKRKMILNVSDLWPIAGLELGIFKKNWSYKLLEKIEHFNYKKANLILGQSEEILMHVKSKFPDKETFLYRNYPEFSIENPLRSKSDTETIKIVYAGLLGVAQGIFKLCQQLNYDGYELHLFGAGSEKDQIEAFIFENPDLPITYHGEFTRTELHKRLLKYDLVIIPLLNRIYGSVPSKIFEYAKLGLPMLYFGGGEGESIILKNKLGWIAESGNYTELEKVLKHIKKPDLNEALRQQIQQTAIEIFDFKTQLKSLITVI